MFIKQVIIDGFKSYASRTVVDGFDPKFNAITGLNGSGKSNILDAICFVLGITQLSQVRVANLQGLVYKQGQSGVTKASVTIVFDNSDAKSSPVGYEHDKEITITRQIAIGGRNKYLINGKNAQAKQVQNLFHSVQLNVNNPHFLIMQGRITKVLNMKAPEILGMIEEAAGTRMFETKKADAEKKMDQKQVKVDEIESILAQEITPKLDKLRGEKQNYLKWSSQNAELERLQRYVVAYKFNKCVRLVAEADASKAKLAEELEDVQQELRALAQQAAELKENEQSMDGVVLAKLGKEVERLSAAEETLSKVLVKESSVLKNRQAALSKLAAKQAKLVAQQEASETQLKALVSQGGERDKALEEAEAVFKAARQGHENAKLGVQAANAGMDIGGSSQDTDAGASQQITMEEKLAGLKASAEESATSAKQSRMKAKHVTKELAAVAKKAAIAAKADTKIRAELAKHEDKTTKLEQQLAELGFNEERADQLQALLDEQTDKLTEARDTAEALATQLSTFEFSFSDPSKGFDRSKVKGTVAKLVTLEDATAATALEVVAGGKLYQVVVDSVDTGKALLNKGKLQKRVTIIPLDKVSARPIAAQKLAAAETIAADKGGSARSALSLVGYDDEVAKAMEYVFGTTLVCDSLATARAVTFNKQVSVRSVTLDGDAFDPQGTLSGGSRPEWGSTLVQLSKLHDAQKAADRLGNEVAKLGAESSELTAKKPAFAKLSQQLSLATHQLSLVKERAAATPFAQLEASKDGLAAQLEQLNNAADKASADATRDAEHASEMEADMEDMEAARSKLVTKAQAELKVAKSALAAADKQLEQARSAAEAMEADAEQLRADGEASQESQTAVAKEADALEAEIAKLAEAEAARKAEYKQARNATDRQKEELSSARTELAGVAAAGKQALKNIQAGELRLKELEAEHKRIGTGAVDADKERRALFSQHAWIASEKQFFGKPHTDYDFAAKSPAEAIKRLRELETTQESMGTSVNKKVMGMIGKAEQEYEDLHRKRAIIEKDRATIERVIKGLEAKKNEALQTTWEKVNRDFGSIFTTLLPGTQAKLDPPEDGTILDGLEVKVAFGNTWKKSLSELSGGQRSLLALALILALLLFKPAPMYILDEVDAALDLSHTQNIGQMLRTHFAHSQFIVVSLKEGMFNNANTIFRTKFVDGLSTVHRTCNKENRKALEEEEAKTKSGKRPRALNEHNKNVVAN